MTAVVISGLGALTPLGDQHGLWNALCEGRSAIREWPDLREQGFRVARAARVDIDGDDEVDRAIRLAVHAATRAWIDAGSPAGRTAVVVGSTMGISSWYEKAGAAATAQVEPGMPQRYTGAIVEALGGATIQRTYGTACAAGSYAVGAAARLVAQGHVDVAIAGGVDAFSRIALTGFTRSRAMDPEFCRPFDANRAGMQLGEAAAFMVLEQESSARARQTDIWARIRSLGLASDAHHPTAPHPDGAGIARAMREALTRAGVSPSVIGHVSAHGTGTRASDAAEARALAQSFGRAVRVNGIKGAIGHTMGAASAVEAIVTAMSLRHGLIPPMVGCREIDPAFDLDVVLEPIHAPGLRYAISNACGFGGINSALLLEAA